MKKGFLSLLAWSLPFLLIAQSNTSTHSIVPKEAPSTTERKGIHWTTGLSWEQVKQKAKAENKYIFIDAYTTWCGPCKMMDRYVYPNDTVGDFFNQHFISIKVQMDRTKNDGEYVRSWYEDAKSMSRRYMIEAFPTAIFLSPDAKMVYKGQGFAPVQDFISMANVALTPGNVYHDPYLEYQNLVSEYKKGIKHYDRMADMIKTAFKLNNGDFARELLKDHVNYASTVSEKERYTKGNIDVWSSFILKPDSKAFAFFLKDGDKIDKVMNQKGYSRDIVDKAIQARIVDSFFHMQKGETMTPGGVKVPNSEIMFHQLAVRADGKPGEPDYVEADWKELENMIRKYFNSDYAKRNVLTARYKWYEQHQNRVGALKAYFARLAKWPPDKLEIGTNDFAWHTFLYSNDKELLKEASKWQGKLIQQWPGRAEILDTYANLFYKLGRTEEAIQWEEKALNIMLTAVSNGHKSDTIEDDIKTYKDVIEKMKKGEPTYLEEGAIWIKGQR